MSDRLRRLLAASVMLVLCGAASACARPVGDFDRAVPGMLHDQVMPVMGKARAKLSGEPMSNFNLTDQEREMHDRVWRFLVAPHAEDWFTDTVVELQRTRLVSAQDTKFDVGRYSRWLRLARYESSRVRYRTLADNAKSDVDTAPGTFLAICRVIDVDRQRAVASRELNGMTGGDVAARRAENDMFVSWFTRALRYRYEAYNYALDHLLVETPHEEALEADGRIGELAVYVQRAESGDFCSGANLHAGHGKDPLPSRVLMPAKDDGIYRK